MTSDQARSLAMARVVAERDRQRTEEGWTSAHDDQHVGGELAMAAACYAAPEPIFRKETFDGGETFTDPWPWDRRWDGRESKSEERKLVIAGALILAELERFYRRRRVATPNEVKEAEGK